MKHCIQLVILNERVSLNRVQPKTLEQEGPMKSLLLVLALLGAQLPSRDTEPTVVLPTKRATITADYGGKYVQLKNTPAIVNLPVAPPKPMPSGQPWYVDVINFGPGSVTLQGGTQFSVVLQPKDTVRIVASNSIYRVAH
jgi:hypothetical protein